jgi:hypothetical protein
MGDSAAIGPGARIGAKIEGGIGDSPMPPFGFRPIDAYFEFFAFRCASHLRRTASAMRLRPSGESRLFLVPATFFVGFAAVFETLAFFLFVAAGAVPTSNARTCFSSAISRSTDARISDTLISSPF